MKSRIGKTAVVATIVLLGIAGSATPASAYTLDECPADAVCLFDTRIIQANDFHRYVINDRSAGTCFDFPVDWDNRMDWVRNNTNHSVTVYTGNVCNGALDPYPILPGQLRNFNSYGNPNEGNSIRFSSSSGSCSPTEVPC